MSSFLHDFFRHAPHVPSRLRSCFGLSRTNSLLPEILAFWALWHCRHARPPDVILVVG
ncbi:MAG: hypothetical protein ACN6O6_06225 [Pseudomonas sp.]|uniref:hypothetical protein n=1 Tax=Pseudomonas sp. TaxID=306 RepID=UPI003D151110